VRDAFARLCFEMRCLWFDLPEGSAMRAPRVGRFRLVRISRRHHNAGYAGMMYMLEGEVPSLWQGARLFAVTPYRVVFGPPAVDT
jgi:hypothetical protein